MTASPGATAVTLPLETVAALVFDDDHVISLFVAFAGAMVAVIVLFSPVFKFNVAGETLMPVTLTTGFVTVTVQVALTTVGLNLLAAVILAVPALTAVTFPLLSTVAMLASEELQTMKSSGVCGDGVAVNFSAFPSLRDSCDLLSVIPVYGCLTVTLTELLDAKPS